MLGIALRFANWLRRRLLDIVGAAAGTVFVGWLLRKLPFKLGENALLGWVDDKIAVQFGITSPSLSAVLDFVWGWLVPLILAIAAIWAYHLLKSDAWKRKQGRRQLLGLGLTVVGIVIALVGLGLIASSFPEQAAEATASAVAAPSGVTPQQSAGQTTPSGQTTIRNIPQANSNAALSGDLIKTDPSDIPKKIAALDAVEDIIKPEGEMYAWWVRGADITQQRWINQLRQGHRADFLKELDEYGKQFDDMMIRISAAQKQSQKFPDVAALFQQPDFKSLKNGLAAFRSAVDKIGDPPYDNVRDPEYWVRPIDMRFNHELGPIENWRRAMWQRWLAMRTELSR
jgi:hypothetical protein